MAPDRPGFALEEAELAARAGDRRGSAAALERARSAASDPEQLHQIALRYQDLKEYAAATALLRRLAGESPRSAVLRADLGVSEFLAGDARAARADLEAALALDPACEPARRSLEALGPAR
jgi:tetratricopeptide (TPR) repeat protein